MFLSEVTDRLYQLGWKQGEVELVRIDLFENYPDIEAEAFSCSMSTTPVDPEVPQEWANAILKKIAAKNPQNAYFENPVYGGVSEEDKELLIAKVKELLPNPETIEDPKERKSVANSITRSEAAIRKGANVGLSISDDNTKLGRVSNFSIPAGNNFRLGACPGATETCEQLCYAKGALFKMNEWRYFVNWAYAQLWPDRFVEIWEGATLSKVVRVHAGGDFYSPEYVDLWIRVAQARPDTRFYAYTRSWQDGKGGIAEEFIDALDRLSKVENFRLILSLDHDTGMPPADIVPAAFRAWLATSDADLPPKPVGLIFRDHDGMGSVASVMGGSFICPVERSPDYTKASGKITCQNCGFCWSTGHLALGLRPDNPAKFNAYAGVDVAARSGLMFKGIEKLAEFPIASNPMTPEDLRRGARTAMSRKAVSAPMRFLESKGHLRGRMLDYGAGHGFDADHFGMEKYDPTYWPDRPVGKFDTIVCNYVLNVVPPNVSDEIIDDISDLLAPHGTAYISVRRDVTRDGLTRSGTYQRMAYPGLPILVEKKGAFAIYTIARGHQGNPAEEEGDDEESDGGECCEDCDTCAADGCFDVGAEGSCETCECCTECCCSCVEE